MAVANAARALRICTRLSATTIRLKSAWSNISSRPTRRMRRRLARSHSKPAESAAMTVPSSSIATNVITGIPLIEEVREHRLALLAVVAVVAPMVNVSIIFAA